MRVRTIGAVAALLLVVSGCGGGDEEQAKTAIADSIMSGSASTFDVKQSEADCIAAGFVDDIGVDQLKEYGIVAEDEEASKNLEDISMSKEDADAAAGAFVDCVDVQELMLGAMPTEGMDAAVIDCVEEAFSEDVIRDILAATFRGEDAEGAMPDVTAALQECMTA